MKDNVRTTCTIYIIILAFQEKRTRHSIVRFIKLTLKLINMHIHIPKLVKTEINEHLYGTTFKMQCNV